MIRDLFLNNTSGLSLNVYLEKAPPIHAPRERGEWIEVAGMDGEAWRGDGALQGFDVELELYVTEDANIDTVLAWLRNATTLRWGSYDWEYHVSGCEIEEGLEDWEEAIGYGWNVKVKWHATPWRYKYPAAAAFQATNPQVISNPCTGWAGPLIQIEGTGNVSLQVGLWLVDVTDLDGGVVIDCEKRMAYMLSGGASAASKVQLTSLNTTRWPRLQPGANTIAWVGSGVTKVTVTPRWRWM